MRLSIFSCVSYFVKGLFTSTAIWFFWYWFVDTYIYTYILHSSWNWKYNLLKLIHISVQEIIFNHEGNWSSNLKFFPEKNAKPHKVYRWILSHNSIFMQTLLLTNMAAKACQRFNELDLSKYYIYDILWPQVNWRWIGGYMIKLKMSGIPF